MRPGRVAAAKRSGAVGYGEVPDFHVAVVRRDDSSLATRSVVVGGDPSKQGKVVAVSGDLRALGIGDGLSTAEALDRAPHAAWVRTDIARARAASGEVRAAVRTEIAALETEGLAGCYLHVPGDRAEAEALATRIATRVGDRTGLPWRFGAAPARFAARLAAEEAAPGGAVVIAPTDFEAWLVQQPLERLPGVGPKTAARLAELGARDVPGLRAIGRERLEVLLGNHGRSVWQLACGEDPKPLRVRRRPASLSREETLSVVQPREPRPVAGAAPGVSPVEGAIRRLAESLEHALHRDGLAATRLALRITGPSGRTATRSESLVEPSSAAAALAAGGLRLLARHLESPEEIRRIALVLKGLRERGEGDRQLDLFD